MIFIWKKNEFFEIKFNGGEFLLVRPVKPTTSSAMVAGSSCRSMLDLEPGPMRWQFRNVLDKKIILLFTSAERRWQTEMGNYNSCLRISENYIYLHTYSIDA